MPALKHFFTRSENVWPLLLILITVVISVLNFKVGTWLTGWDTLHPEFNFPLNIMRTVFGVWREDQGVGTLAAHSHMSDLPRILTMWIFSWALPLNTVKYVYDFLCFILGPLGIYYFCRKVVFKKQDLPAQAAAFLAAMLYIFNLGTVQHFYVVFEMFAVQYAAIGWLFLTAHYCFQKPNRKHFFIFLLLTVLSSPMAYASLLWFAYLAGLNLFLLVNLIPKPSWPVFKKIVVINLIAVGGSAFWLLPNIYFILSGTSQTINQSYINQLFSPEAFLHNQGYGNLQNLALLKNFLFNWTELNADGSFSLLLQPWITHLEQPLVVPIGYVVFGLAMAGVVIGVIKKNKIAYALLGPLILGAIMLINQNPPFTALFAWLRDHLSIFEEGLRFPFTKFSLVYLFALVSFFGIFCEWILRRLGELHKQAALVTVAVISLCLIWYGWPFFQGYLLNPKMRNQIPQSYFTLFEFMETQSPQARLAQLPIQTYAGWDYTTWNYEGPGFIWFGLKQPVMVRDFDRWNASNETFYQQLSTAVYGNDETAFFNILDRYHVSFLLLDKSIISPGNPPEFLRVAEIETFLQNRGLQPIWQEGELSVYQVNTAPTQSFLTTPRAYQGVRTNNTYTRRDPVPTTTFVDQSRPATFYPFSTLTSPKPIALTFTGSGAELASTLPPSDFTTVKLPSVQIGQKQALSARATYNGNQVVVTFQTPFTLSTETQTLFQPASETTTLSNVPSVARIVLLVGDSQIELAAGESRNFNAITTVGQAITITAFDKNEIQVIDQTLVVDEASAQSMQFSSQLLGQVSQSIELPFPSETKELILTFTTIEDVVNNQDFSQVQNCDQFKRGTVSQEIKESGVLFIASDLAVACAGNTLQQVSTDVGYLMRFKGEGLSGRGLKVYLQNLSSNRSDLETILPAEPYDQTYSVLNWPLLPPSTYYLSLETRSFGAGKTSENLLNQISYFPADVSRLAQLSLTNTETPELFSDAVITQSRKFSTYNYVSDVSVQSQSGLLVLSQGYDPGWIAWARGSGIFGGRILSHGEYNDWANAWLLPQGEYRVTIVYLPQYLEFIGFVVVAISFLGVVFYHRKNHT